VETTPFPKYWVAIKLLEKDVEITHLVEQAGGQSILSSVQDEGRRLRKLMGESLVVILAERRYGFITGMLREALRRPSTFDRVSLSDKIDKVVTNRLLGFPIFITVLYVIFWLTFTAGEPLSNWLSDGIGWLAAGIESLWPAHHALLFRSLLVDGVIGGVGAVIVFLPSVVILFMGLAFLEDTGYMARAAFLMDTVMHRIGLHGRSFLPMMVGFGCNVPAVMATRILENRRDRLVTMMVIPLFSCGARLPAYILIISAFFGTGHKALMLMGIYGLGVLLAGLLARLLRSTVLSGENTPFVMELPPYRMPTSKAIVQHATRRSWTYLRKAGTIILAISILLWGLSTFPIKQKYTVDEQVAHGLKLSKVELKTRQSAERLKYSMSGRIGRAMNPALHTMGLDWRVGTAFLGAFAAKEVFITQMGIIFSASSGADRSKRLIAGIQHAYSPLAGLAIMLFLLIASPCMATFAAVKQESGSWRWPILQWTGLTLLGYLLAMTVYQLGSLF